MNEFEKPEDVVLAVLSKIDGAVAGDAVKIISELVDHNETGVALDTLCSQAFECDIELSKEDKTKLKNAARLLDIPISQLDGLSD